MLFIVAVLFLHVCVGYRRRRRLMALRRLLSRHVRRSSVVITRAGDGGSVPRGALAALYRASDWTERLLTGELDGPHLSAVSPKLLVNLSDWTSYLNKQDYKSPEKDDVCKLLMEISHVTDADDFIDESSSIDSKALDHVTPLAWRPGQPFGVLAECSLSRLASVADQFLQGGAMMLDDQMKLVEITTVDVCGEANRLLHFAVTTSSPAHSLHSIWSVGNSDSWQPSNDSVASELSAGGSDVSAGGGDVSWGGGDVSGGGGDVSAGGGDASAGGGDVSAGGGDVSGGGGDVSGGGGDASAGGGDVSAGGGDVSAGGGDVSAGGGDVSAGGGDMSAGGGDVSAGGGDVSAGRSDVSAGRSDVSPGGGEVSADASDTSADGVDASLGTSEAARGGGSTSVLGASCERGKPPNVLIYCGQQDSQRQFESIRRLVQLCLNEDRYTIYHLKHGQVNTTPWSENTQLLLVASERTYDGAGNAFLRYFQEGGAVVSFSSDFDRLLAGRSRVRPASGILRLRVGRWHDVTAVCGCHAYDGGASAVVGVCLAPLGTDGSGATVLLHATIAATGGRAVLSQVSLEKDAMEMSISPEIFSALKRHDAARLEILRHILSLLGQDVRRQDVLQPTPCYLLAVKQSFKEALLQSVALRLQDGVLRSRHVRLQFVDHPTHTANGVTAVVTSAAAVASATYHFSFDAYRENLDTRVLGNVLLYSDVATTTMNILDGLMSYAPGEVGLIVVAGRQLNGLGRSGNAWLSPAGCASFSLHVRLNLLSTLGQHIAYLQHIAALSVIEAVCTLPGYEALDIRLKWPNDIYYGDSTKIGGVLIKSSIVNRDIHANIGCGFNVSNSDPTVCLNDIIRQHNERQDTHLDMLSTEQLIGRSVSQLERLLDLFQTDGCEAFLEVYYNRWLHSNKTVRLMDEQAPEATIIGLDEHGYLSVRTPDGATVSVHPDGNSFDMLRNLIIPKVQR